MQKLNILIFISLFITSLTSSAASKMPVGTWLLTTTAQVEVTAPTGKKIKGSLLSGFEYATFSSNYSYISSEWVNRLKVYFSESSTTGYVLPLDVFGQWVSKNNTYTVSYDVFALSFSDKNAKNINAAFFDRTGYVSLLSTGFGYAPTIDKVQIVAYTDNGKILQNGKALSGTKIITLKADWKDPTTSEAKTALINVTVKYTGKPYTLSSTCCGADAAQNAIDSQAFLDANAVLTGVNKTSSHLQYQILQDGTGDHPRSTDTVTVNYRGSYLSGEIFDSNVLSAFTVSGVIPGFAEGLMLMKQGAKYRLFIPSDLGYGAAGNATIKPNSALIFDVELIGITSP
jgi:hypothetical protein